MTIHAISPSMFTGKMASQERGIFDVPRIVVVVAAPRRGGREAVELPPARTIRPRRDPSRAIGPIGTRTRNLRPRQPLPLHPFLPPSAYSCRCPLRGPGLRLRPPVRSRTRPRIGGPRPWSYRSSKIGSYFFLLYLWDSRRHCCRRHCHHRCLSIRSPLPPRRLHRCRPLCCYRHTTSIRELGEVCIPCP